MTAQKFRFSIDRGGTFTDVYAEVPGEPGFRVLKLLSVDPARYADAPTEGIRRILREVTGKPMEGKVESAQIEWIRMGTTVATNALLERKGARTLLVTTKGFKDLLQIGNQARPNIFDLEIKKPELLYEEALEIDERVRIMNVKNTPRFEETLKERDNVVKGITGEWVEILTAPDASEVARRLKEHYDGGFRSVAVVLLHSYAFRDHEQLVGQIARDIGFEQISLSSDLMPMVRAVPRGHTVCVDAYLTPLITQYVDGFMRGFDDGIGRVNVSFMMSDGGLAPVREFSGHKAILSGPAGGVVGYAMTTYNQQTKQPVIGFDMGGTSTDVSRFAGTYEHVFDTQIAGVTIQAPQLDVNTVAAGGGSRLFFRSGLFVVGPESSGAHPGPVCYRKGGQLSITDANLCLGRVLPDHFPKIFGPHENEPLDAAGTRSALEGLAAEVNAYLTSHGQPQMSVEEVAYGFVKVANETMCRPIRSLTQAKGYDTSAHILACFGGAGGQHACAIARSLGMRTIFIHRFAGILSAYGLGLADLVAEAQEPAALEYGAASFAHVNDSVGRLRSDTRARLVAQGFSDAELSTEVYLNLRYEGTDTSIMTLHPRAAARTSDSSLSDARSDAWRIDESTDFAAAFVAQYRREYGFVLEGRPIIVDDIRVRCVGRGSKLRTNRIAPASGPPQPVSHSKTYFESLGSVDTPVFLLDTLGAGSRIEGPALVIAGTSTIVVEDDCSAEITDAGDVRIMVGRQDPKPVGTDLDPIQLSVFSHRFMSIAEQMGKTLQRTSISTNIKERLDFSCALFGPDGGLVANAPHLPVHLGAMQDAVRWQIRHLDGAWKEGEVLLSNHPAAGGSHLPDMTVITPVHDNGRPVFYVASRGHHADIGGISPGSMPPFSRTLVEEGAAIKSFKLVSDGIFQQAGVTMLLMAPAKVPRRPGEAAMSGTRNLSDNISDLKAQVAANQKGITLVKELVQEYGLEVVQAYMYHVQRNAEQAVREMLCALSLQQGLAPIDSVSAVDFMDDGSRVALKLTINRNDGTAVFDFTGTGHEVFGNINAPRTVTYSAVIYCLRCLVKREIPLNQGCLNPITVIIPDGTLLSPSDTAAVVGGNVLTSQRVTDTILYAFGAAANSQGDMNNFTFGDETVGYYETIAGGAGAGPTWHGAHATQVHMTNTRITDVEILERRYPVLLRQFSIRHRSGGKGRFNGGDGVVRELQFLKDNFSIGILAERRAFAPNGLNGGRPAKRGKTYLIKTDGRIISLGGKNAALLSVGDRVKIKTPGGGGFGSLS